MLVVDDQKVFRDVMRAVVEATPGLRLVGEAGGGEEALRAADALAPELVIVDVRMPGMDGLTLTRILLERTPRPMVLLVSAQPPPMQLPADVDGTPVAFAAKERLCSTILLELWSRRAQAPTPS
ncbi:MAG TPA: response regulator transcription factor [Solirubrobacteraceae bacterium]|nr:response regulator transcription factor [Solirubrobacteraceae bacterium]